MKKKITAKDIEELHSMATLYNRWDKQSMQFALHSIQRKLREFIKLDDRDIGE
tara:strand:- start:347 stop:505 length:159 start_codon:yes stop_codon:yes gene_type:complete